jgi:hypothetical protein
VAEHHPFHAVGVVDRQMPLLSGRLLKQTQRW